jgi:uncharacterized protein YndB with AHSA1/START domain
MSTERITVETTVNAAIADVWRAYTTPADIMKWNTPSDDWHTISASADLRDGGAFSSRMEAKDGSFGFDFAGVYRKIKQNAEIGYDMSDGGKADVMFSPENGGVSVRVTFDPETQNSIEMQRGGWQAILDNFKKHVEAKA